MIPLKRKAEDPLSLLVPDPFPPQKRIKVDKDPGSPADTDVQTAAQSLLSSSSFSSSSSSSSSLSAHYPLSTVERPVDTTIQTAAQRSFALSPLTEEFTSFSSIDPPASGSRMLLPYSPHSLFPPTPPQPSIQTLCKNFFKNLRELKKNPAALIGEIQKILDHPHPTDLSDQQALQLLVNIILHSKNGFAKKIDELNMLARLFTQWPGAFSQGDNVVKLPQITNHFQELWNFFCSLKDPIAQEEGILIFLKNFKQIFPDKIVYSTNIINCAGLSFIKNPEISSLLPPSYFEDVVQDIYLPLDLFLYIVSNQPISDETLQKLALKLYNTSISRPLFCKKRLYLIENKPHIYTPEFSSKTINTIVCNEFHLTFFTESFSDQFLEKLPVNLAYELLCAFYKWASPKLNGFTPRLSDGAIHMKSEIWKKLPTLLKSPILKEPLLRLGRYFKDPKIASLIEPELFQFLQQALARQQMEPFILGLVDQTKTEKPTSLQKLNKNSLFEPRLIRCIAESLGWKTKTKS